MEKQVTQNMLSGNELMIKNPRFTFIYTINLDGKIDIYSILSKHLGKRVEIGEDFNKAKKEFDEGLIEDKMFKFQDIVKDTRLHYFIDIDFLHKAVLGFWTVDKDASLPGQGITIMQGIRNDISQKKSHEKSLIDIVAEKYGHLDKKDRTSSIFNSTQFEEDIKGISIASDIEVKLFSTGAIGILIELSFKPSTQISARDCILLINYPNLVENKTIQDHIREQTKTRNESTPETVVKKEEPMAGLLNIISYKIANVIFHQFMSSIREAKTVELVIERIVDRSKEERSIVTKYRNGKYTHTRVC